MSKINQTEDFQELIIQLLFNDREDNDVFGDDMDSHPKMQEITENILKLGDYLKDFSDDEKYQRAFFDLDSFQGSELAIREQVFYRRGFLDGILICKFIRGS